MNFLRGFEIEYFTFKFYHIALTRSDRNIQPLRRPFCAAPPHHIHVPNVYLHAVNAISQGIHRSAILTHYTLQQRPHV